jgi:hypothetical protein
MTSHQASACDVYIKQRAQSTAFFAVKAAATMAPSLSPVARFTHMYMALYRQTHKHHTVYNQVDKKEQISQLCRAHIYTGHAWSRSKLAENNRHCITLKQQLLVQVIFTSYYVKKSRGGSTMS